MKKNALIVITGAAGFIGSNMVKYLNDRGFDNLVLVDDLTDGKKFKNIKNARFSAYMDKTELFEWLEEETLDYDDGSFLMENEGVHSIVDAIIHLGAISSTTEWNGRLLMENNYKYSVRLFGFCQNYNVNYLYASSASVYGNTIQEGGNERAIDPLNAYAFSKASLDQYVRSFIEKVSSNKEDQVVSAQMFGSQEVAFEDELTDLNPVSGLRFFNVYGPNEEHKGNQASPVTKFENQLQESGSVTVFQETAHRDFIHVEDVCAVIYWLLENPCVGIFDVGTGEPRTFMDVADILAHPHIGDGPIIKIPMPDKFKGHYQYYTKADLTPLRVAGCDHEFMSLEEGIGKIIK